MTKVGRATRVSPVRPASAQTFSRELQVPLDPSSLASTLEKLGLQRSGATHLQIHFFDTPDRQLGQRNVFLRTRITPNGRDLMLKMRPFQVSPDMDPWVGEKGFKVESDVNEDRQVLSASLTLPLDSEKLKALLSGARFTEVLGATQLRFLQQLAKVNTAGLAPPKTWGPIEADRWSVPIPGTSSASDLDEWKFPNGKNHISISFKSKAKGTPEEATFKEFLHRQKLPVIHDPRTKTEIVFEDVR